MIPQIIAMIFYAVLCIIADIVMVIVYGGDDYGFDYICLTVYVSIETAVGIWIARGIF